jgi:hypothetical protein
MKEKWGWWRIKWGGGGDQVMGLDAVGCGHSPAKGIWGTVGTCLQSYGRILQYPAGIAGSHMELERWFFRSFLFHRGKPWIAKVFKPVGC